MFRLLVVVLAVVGLFSLFGPAGPAGFAALLFFPILLLKLAFFLMVLGFIGRRVGRWSGDWSGHHHHRPRRTEPRPSTEERFDEWHRMAHAREEVDSWVEHLPDTGPQ